MKKREFETLASPLEFIIFSPYKHSFQENYTTYP